LGNPSGGIGQMPEAYLGVRMTRTSLDQSILQLKNELLLLGKMVEEATDSAVDALLQADIALAKQVYYNDVLINEKRYAIENAVLIQIATQQPAARDLRFLSAVLEVIGQLERMGDYAKGISKVAMFMERTAPVPVDEFLLMRDLCLDMLREGIRTFIEEDFSSAIMTPEKDDQIDECYNRIYQAAFLCALNNPQLIHEANYIMWAAHNLERLADRVVNICERTIFNITGEFIEFNDEEEEELI
jgi:phosphate transport system protein